MDYSQSDLYLAIQLQAQFNKDLKVHEKSIGKTKVLNKDEFQVKKPKEVQEQEKFSIPLSDPSWELIDPNPDIYTLFRVFNGQFFWNNLDAVVVEWSKTMTLCAGICRYESRAGMCEVRLSVPLLKLRPRKDLIDTLLHEMIHAFLFVTHNNRDRSGHGPIFHEHMYRINRIAGTSITVYHKFHDEVAVYKQHIWQCNGPCQHRHPYYGLLKRSKNRAPSKFDPWWAEHQSKCGGTYIKIQEPPNYSSKKRKANDISTNTSSKEDIRKFFKKSNIGTVSNSGSATVSSVTVSGASKASILKLNTSNNIDKHTTGSKRINGAGTVINSKISSTVNTLGGSKSKSDAIGNSNRSKTIKARSFLKLPTVDNSNISASEKVTSKLNTVRESSNELTNLAGPSNRTAATSQNSLQTENFVPFRGNGRAIGYPPNNMVKKSIPKIPLLSECINLDNSVIIIDDDNHNNFGVAEETKQKSLFSCPMCQQKFSSVDINLHVETHF